ncbi:hypothetical protein GCM10009759_37790 [Kitasatospora saccharophila]|uniref:Ig-like domain-containing protein n=1 Tax=Kitasatospora saccharophila TaxID=407973 RepID=A0ABP5IMQ4_9ACTN
MLRTGRATTLTGLLALLLGGAGLSAGAPAQAAPALLATVNCTGWTYTTYSPGLTHTVRPTTVTVDGNLNVTGPHSPTGSCLAVGSTASAGERDVTALLELSCDQLLTETGTETVRWNNGTSSSFPFTATVVRGLATTVITETGTVTSGEFLGGTAVETFTAPNLDLLACDRPGGASALNFATVLTIL